LILKVVLIFVPLDVTVQKVVIDMVPDAKIVALLGHIVQLLPRCQCRVLLASLVISRKRLVKVCVSIALQDSSLTVLEQNQRATNVHQVSIRQK
jgi:hypothetical protein